jgi:16S rRNA (adenine1518-N6/adenine1519-N6)-dimethyltransferase
MNMEVKPKKHLGQHFLKDQNIAKKISETLQLDTPTVLEIGPGMGVLTNFLKENKKSELYVAEVDPESVEYLIENKIMDIHNIVGDFLNLDIPNYFESELAVIGNFPYNISSQIVFKTIDNKEKIPEFAGMFQKEVAERICAAPGSKQYGIISVLTQAYYNTEYLFTVDEQVFNPPPKVKSGVIRLTRKENLDLGCDEKLFKTIVKNTFNTRRKMLRVSLKRIIGSNEILQEEFFQKRPEQLSVDEFVWITKRISENR